MKTFSTGPLENVEGSFEIMVFFISNESNHIVNLTAEFLELINGEATSLQVFINTPLNTGLTFIIFIVFNSSDSDGWEFQFEIDDHSDVLISNWWMDENMNLVSSHRVLNSELTQIEKLLFPPHCLKKSCETNSNKENNKRFEINAHSDAQIFIWEQGKDGKFTPSYRNPNNELTSIEKILFSQ